MDTWANTNWRRTSSSPSPARATNSLLKPPVSQGPDLPGEPARFLLQGRRCPDHLRDGCQWPRHQPDPAPERRTTCRPNGSRGRSRLTAPTEHKEITIDPKSLMGTWASTNWCRIYPKDHPREDQLFAQATGQPKVQIFPESDTRLFYKVVDAQITSRPIPAVACPQPDTSPERRQHAGQTDSMRSRPRATPC